MGFKAQQLQCNSLRLMFNRQHEAVHFFLLLLDGLDQFELRPTAVKVLVGAMHLEICVSGQIVREEPDADL
jgi:hypothetical protein